MKTIHRFAVLFLIVLFVSCQKNNDEPLYDSDEIVIANGMIQNPKWLVHVIDSVAYQYQQSPGTGDYPYPWVYQVKHNDQEYIYVSDGLSSCWTCGHLFFTLSGELIDSNGSPEDSPMSLYYALVAESERTLLWRQE